MEKLLRQALNDKGMTQKELAEEIGVTPQAVSNWLNGDSRPSNDNVTQIYRVLGVDLTKEMVTRERAGKTRKVEHTSLKELDSFGKAKAEATAILDQAGFASKYSHHIYMLCNWLLTAVIGLCYHKMIHDRDPESEYGYYDIFYNLEEYLGDGFIEKNGLYKNQLEYDFYIMGMDLFESFGDDKMINHDYCDAAMDIWYRYKYAVGDAIYFPQLCELRVAITELIVIHS